MVNFFRGSAAEKALRLADARDAPLVPKKGQQTLVSETSRPCSSIRNPQLFPLAAAATQRLRAGAARCISGACPLRAAGAI